MTTEAPAAPETTTLLDAPTDTKAGATGTQPGDTTDTKPTESVTGQDGKTVPASSDKTPPAEALKPDQPAKATDTPATGAPEKYTDPVLPEGMALDPEIRTKFDALAKDLNLSQDQYQKVIDLQTVHASSQAKLVTEAFQRQVSEWSDETKKELGADPQKSLAVASKAIDSIFSDPKENKEFREMMKISGLGNWRLMVKAFSFVGKAISEDRFVEGNPGSQSAKSIAERIYDTSPTK